MRNSLLLTIVITISACAFAQRIENTAAHRQISGNSYLKVHFDNDFFTHTDWYYSQGFAYELVNPALKKNPLSILLVRLNRYGEEDKRYGLLLENNGFTPTDLIYTMPRDRPFAATLTLKSFMVSNNYNTGSRLTSGLVLGVIGPAAFGKEIQTWIHRWTNNYLPKGWPNQISNDVIVNYNVSYEQRLFHIGEYLSLHSNLQVSAGTLSDKVQAGLTLMTGKLISPFEPDENKRRFQLYAYTQPLFSIVGYDATLQGGMFNRASPYKIRDGELSRFTFQNQTGIVLQIYRFQLEAFLSYLTPEFNYGRPHRWGGLRLGIQL